MYSMRRGKLPSDVYGQVAFISSPFAALRVPD